MENDNEFKFSIEELSKALYMVFARPVYVKEELEGIFQMVPISSGGNSFEEL